MRRLTLILTLAALLVIPSSLTAAPPKPQAVTNPLTADLDGGGHSITNVQNVYAGNVFSRGQFVAGTQGLNGTIQFSTESMFNGPAVIAGDNDPTTNGGILANAGSLFLRSNGQWWRKTSSNDPTAWTCEAGCTP